MDKNYKITELDPAEFKKCGYIWDMDRQSELAEKFYRQLLQGARITYVCQLDRQFIGEISLVFDMDDVDYTIEKHRIYVSRLIVKQEYRHRGIGRKLLDHAAEAARNMGYSELSVGVDLDNYPALKLYVETGFREILFIGEDADGKYAKLLRCL